MRVFLYYPKAESRAPRRTSHLARSQSIAKGQVWSDRKQGPVRPTVSE